MAYVPARKAGLLIPSGSYRNPDAKHLFFILTDRCADGLHLLSSVTTIREGVFHDATCVITAGEHPFIKHDSYFEYRRLTSMHSAHITTCVDGWEYMTQDEASDDLYERVCNGIENSEFTPRGMLDYWRQNH